MPLLFGKWIKSFAVNLTQAVVTKVLIRDLEKFFRKFFSVESDFQTILTSQYEFLL